MRLRLNPLNIIFVLLIFSFGNAEKKLHIVESVQLPEQLKALRLKPDRISWSLRNSFLLLDSYNSELLLLKNSGEVKFSSGLGIRNNMYGELIWAGISPIGIQVIDRLENKVMILDLNLNFMHNISINHSLYPEMAQIDPWGELFMYSNTYNGIFIYLPILSIFPSRIIIVQSFIESPGSVCTSALVKAQTIGLFSFKPTEGFV